MKDAIRSGDSEQVANLLKQPAAAEIRIQIGSTRQYWTTPLHLACEAGKTEIVEVLLAHGVDPEIYNYEDQTPLFGLINCGYEHRALEILPLLVKHGADVNHGCGRHLNFPLIFAATLSRAKLVEALIALGADVNAQDHAGNTALHMAALEANPNSRDETIVSLLIEAGANIDVPNNVGKRPSDAITKTGEWRRDK